MHVRLSARALFPPKVGPPTREGGGVVESLCGAFRSTWSPFSREVGVPRALAQIMTRGALRPARSILGTENHPTAAPADGSGNGAGPLWRVIPGLTSMGFPRNYHTRLSCATKENKSRRRPHLPTVWFGERASVFPHIPASPVFNVPQCRQLVVVVGLFGSFFEVPCLPPGPRIPPYALSQSLGSCVGQWPENSKP